MLIASSLRKKYLNKISLDTLLVDIIPAENKSGGFILAVPPGLRSIISFLREKGHSAEILYNLIPTIPSDKVLFSVFPKEIINKKPLILGFSPYQPLPGHGKKFNYIYQIEKIVKILHAKGIYPYIILGGHFATFNSRKLMNDLPWIDFIARGEGEEILNELIIAIKERTPFKNINGLTYRKKEEIIENPPRPRIEDLNSLPMPVYDHLDLAQKLDLPIDAVFLHTSRGCYGNCTFCSIQSFYRLSSSSGAIWKGKSPKNVVDEFEFISKKYKCSFFHIADDNFMGPGKFGRERAEAIAREIIKRGLKIKFRIMCRPNDIEEHSIRMLKKAGLHSVSIGIESGAIKDLIIYSKKTTPDQNKNALTLLNKIGVKAIMTFIFLNPYSSLEKIKENIDFYHSTQHLNNVEWAYDTFLMDMSIYSGTLLKERLEKEGLLKGKYIEGYSYNFQDEKMVYFKKIQNLFNALSLSFDTLISKTCFIHKNKKKKIIPLTKRLSRTRKKLCGPFALKTLEKAVNILEGQGPGKINHFIKDLESKIRNIILWNKTRETLLRF